MSVQSVDILGKQERLHAQLPVRRTSSAQRRAYIESESFRPENVEDYRRHDRHAVDVGDDVSNMATNITAHRAISEENKKRFVEMRVFNLHSLRFVVFFVY